MVKKDNDEIAIELVTQIVAETDYKNGEMVKAGDSLTTNIPSLLKLSVYPNWLNFEDILMFILSELRKVKNDCYDGNPSAEDSVLIATEFHKMLKAAPHDYIFYFEMPNGLRIEEDISIDKGSVCIRKITPKIENEIISRNQFTYLRSDRSLRGMLDRRWNVNMQPIKPTPNYIKLITDKYYLEVHSKGFNAENHVSTVHSDHVDPIHIYKLLIAFMSLKGFLHAGDLLHTIFGKTQASYGKEATIYKNNLEFVTNYLRPLDEADYVSGLVFSDNIDPLVLTTELGNFQQLINSMKNEYLELERNKIINSLYWYFEGEKSATKSFKTLMQVSMFDSFYTVKDKQEDTIKSILETCGYQDKTEIQNNKSALKKVYEDRNDIAHGNIHLLEVARDLQQMSLTDGANRHRVSQIYRKYINAKIEKLLIQ